MLKYIFIPLNAVPTNIPVYRKEAWLFNQAFGRFLDLNTRPVILPQVVHDLLQFLQKRERLYSSEHQL
jgi:hypothetical protein